MAFRLRPHQTGYADTLAAPVKDRSYLSWLHTLPCVVSGREGDGVQAAHLRAGNLAYAKPQSGGQQKPDDYWCLPLFHTEHTKQHSMNEEAYWQRVGIDPWDLCCRLRMAFPNEEKARAIILHVRARRSAA
ncbi:hypothetical protein [Polycladidibacter hongkongensis]|uniref:hypothetical protein n=1 Tax=Polycladidibacter hongkongensis TaxID=1647556 RepID=UPI0008312BC1|nr:hypothetical protein [Pseudovibrio hongkongensis]